jgi:hypothetical protein
MHQCLCIYAGAPPYHNDSFTANELNTKDINHELLDRHLTSLVSPPSSVVCLRVFGINQQQQSLPQLPQQQSTEFCLS